MGDYNEELNYRLDLMYALSGEWEAEQLAQQLVEYGKLEGDVVLTERQERLDVIQDLALNIKSDAWQLQRFREAYLFGILSVPDSERRRIVEAIRELCAAQIPFLEKSLRFQLKDLKEILTRLEAHSTPSSAAD